ncbi:hypothetical protein [Croceibacterium aestuarii]|uniref:hypothetical protein n=1 Tax=Croceibacterium aestuarii TaxID=3064139 RepID=UPI00272ED342|nr:hypothetical protein [Croceibacterium sp. D39]
MISKPIDQPGAAPEDPPLSGPSEQMFFFGAPLAHVITYEEIRRDERLRWTYRQRSRELPVPPRFTWGDTV